MQFATKNADSGGQLKIIKNSVEYILPVGWALKDSGSYDFNAKIADRAYVHGGEVSGDKKVKGRTIQVEFDMQGATEEAHDEALNVALSYFTGTDYTLFVGREDRYYKVAACSKVKHEFEKGFKQRWSNITVSLLLADPFRYDTTPTVITKNYTEAQEETEILINNPTPIDTPLIWSFTPPEGSTAPDIKVLHMESGESFQLTDTLLTAPAIAVVNGETGTVRRDNGNSLNTFSGIFLHVQPGQNTFKYTGAACKIDIQYTGRWFV